MKNRRKLKEKVKIRQLRCLAIKATNNLIKGANIPVSQWYRKQQKWESYKLKEDKQVPLQVDLIDDVEFPGAKTVLIKAIRPREED